MKKDLTCILLIIFIGITFPAKTQIKAYPIDSWHSRIGFSIKFANLMNVYGNFNDFKGTVLFDEEDTSKLSVTIIINAKSINTGVDMRDDDLRKSSYFDVEKFPEFRFYSKRTRRNGNGYQLIGDLTMHDLTKEIEIAFTVIHSEQKDPWKNYRISLGGNLVLNRTDFEIGEGKNFIAKEVMIELLISARILNTETIGMFNRPFGNQIFSKIKDEGIEAVKQYFFFLKEKKDPDALDPFSIKLMYLKLNQSGMLTEATEICKLGIEVYPERAASHSLLGYAYYENGEIENAKKAFQKALELDDDNTLAIEMTKYLNSE